MVYSNATVYGVKLVWYFRSIAYFLFLHLMMLLKCILFRASFLHIIKDTDRTMQLRFF